VGSIGFVMITYGISSSLFSFIGGKLSKLTGTIVLLGIGKFVYLDCVQAAVTWHRTDKDNNNNKQQF